MSALTRRSIPWPVFKRTAVSGSPPQRRAPRTSGRGAGRGDTASESSELLELDGPAGLLDVGLELVGLLLLDALLHGLGGLVDEGLRLLEPETGGGADDLDHLDLLVAGGGEDDVEARLLLGGRSGVTATATCGRSGRGDGGRRHAERLLQRLDALGELQDGDRLQLVDPFLSGGHDGSS